MGLAGPREAGLRAVRRQALVPALLLLAASQSMVASLGAPLVPLIAREHDVSLSTAQWVVTASFLSGAVATPLLGRLGSTGLRRRPVVIGALASVLLGTVVAALPLGFEAMVAGRVLQGLGLAMTPVAIAVAREVVEPERRAGVLAALSVTVVTASGMIFPLASFVAHHGGISAAYWCASGLVALSLLACSLVLPHGTPTEPRPLDLVGALILGAGVGALLLVASRLHVWGAASATTTSVCVLAVVLLGWWVQWTLRADHPLVDLRLAIRPGVLAANITAVLAGIAMYVNVTLVALIVQSPVSSGYGLGHSVTYAGLMLVPFAVASVAGSWTGRRMTRFVPADQHLAVGALFAVLGALSLTLWRDDLWQVSVGMALCGLGNGNVFSAMPGLIVRFVPVQETGSAMAFNQVLRYLGFAAGSALVVTVAELASRGSEMDQRGITTAFLVSAGVSAVSAAIACWLAGSVPAGSPEP